MEARISGDVPLAFVEKVLREEKLVDKSIIETICITTTGSLGYALGERLCGILLQFFKPNEIKETNDEYGLNYEFPYGTINVKPLGMRTKRQYGTICFEYKKENWVQIDKVISYLDNIYSWESIKYVLNKRINMEKLVDKCKEKDFQLIAYNPGRYEKRIKTRTKAWLNSETTFTSGKDYSSIEITASKFPEDFYSTLSPENIIEFIKDCLEG